MESQQIRSLIESELIVISAKDCCKIAFISGAIRGSAQLNFTPKGFSLEFRNLNKTFVELVAGMLCSIYGENLPVEKINLKSGYMSGEFFTLYVPAFIASDLLDKCGIVSGGNNIISNIPSEMIKSSCCKKSYLRGLYLGCGYLKVPQSIDNFELNSTKSGYELSFKLNSSLVKEDIKVLISKVAKITERSVGLRKNSNIIYIKNSQVICNFFTAIGSNRGVLEIYQIMTERKMKNDINRANNFDLANIDKSLATGEKQIRAINIIDRAVGLDSLPEELKTLAYLRLANPDASLTHLAEISEPALTKSGINHRFRRIMDIASKTEETN